MYRLKTLRWSGAFGALRNPYFRWLWLGGLAASATFQMSNVAQGWLVYQITGSALALGWVSSGWSIAMMLFSLYGGVISDRAEKRRLLIWTRCGLAFLVLATAILISLGSIRIWHLVVGSTLSGILFAFMVPAGQAYLCEVVDRPTLLNAVSLNAIGMAIMGIVGSWAAGLLTEAVGVAAVYYAIAACHLANAVAMMRLPPARATVLSGSPWADLKEGVRYLQHEPVIIGLIGLALARVLFGIPYVTFMPKFVQEVLSADASGLGLLLAATGAGGLVSALTVASLGDYRRKGLLLLVSGACMGICLILFTRSRAILPAALSLVLVGASANVSMVTVETLIQATAGDRFRGRIMSMYMMVFGLMPLGTVPAGLVADSLGVPAVVAVQGAVLALLFVGVGVLWPHMRKLE
ncbi:MAG: MFS transporter [Anaerolineae bacterium]